MRNSNQAFTNKPKRRRLGITALEERLGYSRQSIWRFYTKGDFPIPHYLGQKRCWFEDEVEAWENKQMSDTLSNKAEATNADSFLNMSGSSPPDAASDEGGAA